MLFIVNLCEICKSTFFVEHFWTTASDYRSINSSKRKLASKTVNCNTKIKAHQFELELEVMTKVNPVERTGLTRVFEERI